MRDGLNLRYRVFPATSFLRGPRPERGSIVILPGRSESALKYAETIFDLNAAGFRVYAFDHRGQGYSDRAKQRDAHMGHVANFQHYVDDFATFHDSILAPATNEGARRIFFLAHSMGACVLSMFLSQRPEVQPTGVILSAPMWSIAFGTTPPWLARAILLSLCLAGRGEHYAPSSGPLSIEEYGNDLTDCPERLEMLRRVLRENPALRVGGPSCRWLLSAIEATRRLRKGALLRRTFSRPTLLLESGADTVLDARANRLVDGTPGLTRINFAEARHDIFYAKDPVRRRVMKEVDVFLETYAPDVDTVSSASVST